MLYPESDECDTHDTKDTWWCTVFSLYYIENYLGLVRYLVKNNSRTIQCNYDRRLLTNTFTHRDSSQFHLSFEISMSSCKIVYHKELFVARSTSQASRRARIGKCVMTLGTHAVYCSILAMIRAKRRLYELIVQHSPIQLKGRRTKSTHDLGNSALLHSALFWKANSHSAIGKAKPHLVLHFSARSPHLHLLDTWLLADLYQQRKMRRTI